MRLSLLCLLPVCLLAARGEEPEARAQALLAGLTEVQRELCFDAAFGLYTKTRRVGQVEVSVGGTSSYDVLLKSEVAVGGEPARTQESLELAPDFGLRRKSLHRTRGPEVKEEETRTHVDGEWAFRAVAQGAERAARLASDAAHHDELPCLLLLARVLDLSQAQTYALRSVRWQGEGLEVVPLTLRVEPGVEYLHRGEARLGSKLHVSRAGVEALVLYTSERDVLQVEFSGTSLRLIQGTAREIARDLRDRTTVKARTPKQVVLGYLRATLTGDVDDLDELCDWEALRLQDATRWEWAAELSAEDYAAAVKTLLGEFAQQGELPAAALGLMALGLSQRIEGERATVRLRGAEGEFVLERRDDRWWIVRRPED
ncbi:MAG: hypothetical protein R3F62_24375 [Planctomycetota bacterium]